MYSLLDIFSVSAFQIVFYKIFGSPVTGSHCALEFFLIFKKYSSYSLVPQLWKCTLYLVVKNQLWHVVISLCTIQKSWFVCLFHNLQYFFKIMHIIWCASPDPDWKDFKGPLKWTLLNSYTALGLILTWKIAYVYILSEIIYRYVIFMIKDDYTSIALHLTILLACVLIMSIKL